MTGSVVGKSVSKYCTATPDGWSFCGDWAAARQGLRMEKSRVRDPRAIGYGTYMLVDERTNTVAAAGHPPSLINPPTV
jgi:hypothetical protein